MIPLLSAVGGVDWESIPSAAWRLASLAKQRVASDRGLKSTQLRVSDRDRIG